jgi:hypothetical protein
MLEDAKFHVLQWELNSKSTENASFPAEPMYPTDLLLMILTNASMNAILDSSRLMLIMKCTVSLKEIQLKF